MVINVSKEKAKLDAAKAAAAAKTAASTSNFTYGSGNPKPTAPSTQTLNLYGSPTPSKQTLNLYGSPASIAAAKSVVTPKPSGSNIPAAKSREQIAADAKAIADKLAGIQSRVDALGTATTVPSGDSTPGKTVLRSVTNADGTVTIFYSDGTSETFGTPTDNKKEVVKSPNVAYDTIQKILESYRITGLASVLESIRDEYPEASPDELMTLLQFDDRYNAKFNERFAGNVTRMKAGKPVYSPGEYLKLEQAFDKVLTSYNQPAFKNQSYYDKWIVGDVDAVEVAERVQLGYDRVLGDDPVNKAFTKFYSALGYSDIVAGMLDPVNQLPALQQKVRAAEIGGAALRQGFKADEISLEATASTLGADILAKQGVTKAQAEKAYGKIAGVLPTAEKLSSIYGSTEAKYGRLEAEEEEFQGLASAERKRKRLSGLETAQFQSDSGMATQSLKQISAGQY